MRSVQQIDEEIYQRVTYYFYKYGDTMSDEEFQKLEELRKKLVKEKEETIAYAQKLLKR